MGDTISKVNQINFLATKVSQDQNTSSLKDKNNQDLRNVAEQFESIFINMMLKSMRNATERSSLMDSQAGRMYESMFDQEVSLHLAKNGSLGLAETIKSQIQRNQERMVSGSDQAYSLEPQRPAKKILSEEHSYSIDIKRQKFSLDRRLTPAETGADK